MGQNKTSNVKTSMKSFTTVCAVAAMAKAVKFSSFGEIIECDFGFSENFPNFDVIVPAEPEYMSDPFYADFAALAEKAGYFWEPYHAYTDDGWDLTLFRLGTDA